MDRTIHVISAARRPGRALSCATTALVAAWLLAGVSCARREPPAAAVIRPVRTITVGGADRFEQRTFSGRTRATIGTILSFRVSGEIQALRAKLGMPVQAGDIIAQLDTTDYDLQARQLEAQLAQAEAQFKQARADYERTRSLYEASSASKSDLDKDRARYESAQAQSDSLQKSLDLAHQQIEYCTLRAPMAGTISSVPVEVHTTVQAGQTIAGLNAGGALQIECGMPESLISQVRAGDQATVQFDAVPNVPFAATVAEVGVQSSESSTFPVRLDVQATDPRVLAGMACSVTFARTFQADRSFVIVPSEAVVGTPAGEQFVWIYDRATSTVRRRIVRVGSLTSGGLQIREGLTAGDIVVIRGVHQLDEGMKVKLLAVAAST